MRANNLRELSKRGFVQNNEIPSLDEIDSGSLQRIADATEAMALNYQVLIGERDRFERWWLKEQCRADRLERSNAGLRGHITRLKRATK